MARPLTRRESDLLGRARALWQAQERGDAAGELRSFYGVIEVLRRRESQPSTPPRDVVDD
jgi:hypothetical protein